MDTVQPVEDDAASEATRPTSKPGGCEESVPSWVTAQWCWWPLARPVWVSCQLASHRRCHADSQHGFCERAQTPGSVSGGVPGRGLDPSGRAAHASALLRSESLRPCISGPHRRPALMRGPCPRSGRRLVVETVVHRCLAGLPGPTAELGGL